MKVVINTKYGGFGLSEEAVLLYGKKKGLNIIKDKSDKLCKNYYIDEIKEDNYFADWDIERNDPCLVEVIEELGVNGCYGNLKIVEIPDDVKWYISEDHGIEEIHEQHRKWS